MRNIAIIIGVNNYANVDQLPSCKNDASTIYRLIVETGKYNEILFISEETESYKIMDKVIEFIKHNNADIDEFFFYFSGHGVVEDNEYYLGTTDILPGKIKSTSISNSDLDTLFRNISPNLYVKIIDACQSGVTYIKGEEIQDGSREELLKKSLKGFQKCIFMNSSMINQSSYANKEISDFTKSFLDCVINAKKMSVLRYKHIIDFISDDFTKSRKQKPFFVLQADMTEEFCTINEKIIQIAEEIYQKQKIDSDNDGDIVVTTMEDKLVSTFSNFATIDEAKTIMEEILDFITTFNFSNTIIEGFFDVSYEILNSTSSMPNRIAIGQWVKENGKQIRCFAHEKIYKDYPRSVVGYENTATEMPKGIRVTVTPMSLGLPQYQMVIAFIFSYSDLYMFFSKVTDLAESWGKFSAGDYSDLTLFSFKLKSDIDKIKNQIKDELSGFEKYILDSLSDYVTEQ